MPTKSVDFLQLKFSEITFPELKRRLASVTAETPYAYVVTPNVDHVVRLHAEPSLKRLYSEADLCLCDSRMLRRLAWLGSIDLRLIPGSDLTQTILSQIIQRGDRIAIVGGDANLAQDLRRKYPGIDFVQHIAPFGLRQDHVARRVATRFIVEASARFTFVAVGSPQQEMIAWEARNQGARGLALCIGASLEFLTGKQKRAPLALQRWGLEWVHRLLSDPRRLWRRYLVDGARIVPIYAKWSRLNRSAFPLVFLMTILAVAAAAGALLLPQEVSRIRAPVTQKLGETSNSETIGIQLPPPDLLKPLTSAEAEQQNFERPFSTRPDRAASQFKLSGSTESVARATECLAQAIYYEAASEGLNGGRAVAQVVLNRVRHPAYPNTVCGVIYQGSDRATGCQFSFTCDGSLGRTAAQGLWRRSQAIARDALGGKVFAAVGHATHYHADYVLPYWADSLDKTVKLGSHIFYRLRGTLGAPPIFRQRYGGLEPEVRNLRKLPVELPTINADLTLNATIVDNMGAPLTQQASMPADVATDLLVDKSVGVMIGDDGGSPHVTPSRPMANDCSVRPETNQLRPMLAEKLKVDYARHDC